MDDLQSMDLLVACLFLYKHVVNDEPPFKGNALLDANIKSVSEYGEDIVRATGGHGPFIVVVTVCK